MKTIRDDREKQILHALCSMCSQYMSASDGSLYHQFMSPGEDACDILEEFGLIDGDETGGRWTESGLALLNDPELRSAWAVRTPDSKS